MCHMKLQKHIYTLKGLEHALRLLSEVLLNTHWNYQQFKTALKAVAATEPNLELFYQNKLGWTGTLELNTLNAYLRYQPVCGESVCDRVSV